MHATILFDGAQWKSKEYWWLNYYFVICPTLHDSLISSFSDPDELLKVDGGGGATDPFCGMGTWSSSTETQQSGHAPRSGPEVKNRRSSAKRWRAGEARTHDNPGGGESDPAKGVHRRCMKNSPSVLSCIGKRTIEGCDHGSEVGTAHSGWDGEGPVPLMKPDEPKESGRRESFCWKFASLF